MSDESSLQDRQGEVFDAQRVVSELISELSKTGPEELEEELEEAKRLADAIEADLQCAESCETEADFDANIKTAVEHIAALKDCLKSAKAAGRKAGVDTDIVEEALGFLKQIKSDVNDLLPES